MNSYQMKAKVASHSERGIAYKPGEVIRTDRNLIALHPHKFIDVGTLPDTHWPADIPWKDDENGTCYVIPGESDTFRVMKGSECVRRGLTADKAWQICRNTNNGFKSPGAVTKQAEVQPEETAEERKARKLAARKRRQEQEQEDED